MFTDDFNRANENLEASANWTRVDGTAGDMKVISNQVEFDTIDTAGAAYQCPDQGSADHYTRITRVDTATSGAFMCAVRLTDNANYIGVRYWSGSVELYKKVSGTFTVLADITYTASANDVYTLRAMGNRIEVWVNNSKLASVTESFNNTETRQGFVARNATLTCDNFEAGVLQASVAAGTSVGRVLHGPLGAAPFDAQNGKVVHGPLGSSGSSRANPFSAYTYVNFVSVSHFQSALDQGRNIVSRSHGQDHETVAAPAAVESWPWHKIEQGVYAEPAAGLDGVLVS